MYILCSLPPHQCREVYIDSEKSSAPPGEQYIQPRWLLSKIVFKCINRIHVSMLYLQKMRRETFSVLSQVLQYTHEDWPCKLADELKPFQFKAEEMSIEARLHMWGIHVIVPTKLQSQVLYILHKSHPGMTKMKMMARRCIWWPGIDSSIKCLIRS